jgi:flagellar basal-body rod protein FlgC
MSSLSISASGLAAANLRLQVSASNVANISDIRRLPDANASSTAAFPSASRIDQVAVAGGGTAATITATSPSYVTQYDPIAPAADKNGLVAAPNVDLANEAVQQITAGFASAANAKAIQAGSSTIHSLLDIKI